MQIRLLLSLIIAPLSSSACTFVEEAERADAVAAGPGQPERPNAPETPAPATTRGTSFVDNTGEGVGERMFSYAWPAQVDAIAPLAAQLTRERDAALAEQKAEWEAAKADAPDDCDPCRTRSSDVEWQVVADLPRFLSLSASVSTYSGGAHGNYGTAALVWDRERGRRIEATDLFRSATSLENAIGRRFCAALNTERAERRGEPVVPGEDWMVACPGIEEVTILLGSSNGRTFDRIGVLADPYVAGPWAEGAYEITLPVDTALLDAVQPRYAAYFSLGARK